MKLAQLIKMFALGGMLLPSAVYAELQSGKGQILWTENFLPPLAVDATAVKGWSLFARQGTRARVQVAVEGQRARIWNISAKNMTAFGRYIPLYPKRIKASRAKVVYQQLMVTKVEKRQIMWLLPGGTWVSGDHPGIYTMPYMQVATGKAVPVKKYYRIDFFGRGYIEVDFLRLVCGLPPMGVIWKRTGDPNWENPIKPGEKLTIEARLGNTTASVMLEFLTVSFNSFRKYDLLKNKFTAVKMYDDGRNGDRQAGDGIWTFQFKYTGSAKLKARMITAGISFGSSKTAKAYGVMPWAFSK